MAKAETKVEATESYNYCYDDKFLLEDLENRKLYLNGEIDEGVIENIVYHIMRYNRIDKGVAPKDRKPIIFYINSPGGSVADGFGLIDVILNSKTPVYTVNQASCFSMGFLVFLSGEKRYSFPHSEFLMHDGSTAGYDSMAKMRDRMQFETVELENATKGYILSRTKINEDLYNEKYRCEWYFLPEKAKEIGAVDFIVGQDCDIDDII